MAGARRPAAVAGAARVRRARGPARSAGAGPARPAAGQAGGRQRLRGRRRQPGDARRLLLPGRADRGAARRAPDRVPADLRPGAGPGGAVQAAQAGHARDPQGQAQAEAGRSGDASRTAPGRPKRRSPGGSARPRTPASRSSTSLHEAAEAYALEHPEAVPEQLPGDAERNRVIRAAIAEAQRQHPTWTRAHLEWELYRQMPVLPAGADWCAYLDAMADDALAGRVPDTGVIRIAPVPDLVDVSIAGSPQGRHVGLPAAGRGRSSPPPRTSTPRNGSSRRPPRGRCRSWSPRAGPRPRWPGRTWTPQQRQAVTGMLTSGRFFSCLVAAAGTGKTHVMAAFARRGRRSPAAGSSA